MVFFRLIITNTLLTIVQEAADPWNCSPPDPTRLSSFLWLCYDWLGQMPWRNLLGLQFRCCLVISFYPPVYSYRISSASGRTSSSASPALPLWSSHLSPRRTRTDHRYPPRARTPRLCWRPAASDWVCGWVSRLRAVYKGRESVRIKCVQCDAIEQN